MTGDYHDKVIQLHTSKTRGGKFIAPCSVLNVKTQMVDSTTTPRDLDAHLTTPTAVHSSGVHHILGPSHNTQPLLTCQDSK